MITWKSAALNEVAAIERDALQPEAIKSGTIYVGLEHIESGGNFLEPPLVEAGVLASSKFQFTDRHVLYGKLRPYLAKIACPDFNGICSTDILPILPGPKLDRRFLFHYLRQPLMVDYANSQAVGANLPRLSPSVLAKFAIPLPPLAEQQRIAEVLDRVEALRAKRREAIALIDTLAQSIFLDMFGDPATNPKGWPVTSTGDLARQKANNGIFKKNPEYIHDGKSGRPVVWVEELFREQAIDTKHSRRLIPSNSEIEKYGLNNGDILFCRSSLKLDGIAFNNVFLGEDKTALFECHLIRISPDKNLISPVYLNYLLRLPGLRAIAKSKSKTSTMTTIDQASVCSLPVMLPPLDLQLSFTQRITVLDSLKSAHRASLAELDALFASLQHRAFRGEL